MLLYNGWHAKSAKVGWWCWVSSRSGWLLELLTELTLLIILGWKIWIIQIVADPIPVTKAALRILYWVSILQYRVSSILKKLWFFCLFFAEKVVNQGQKHIFLEVKEPPFRNNSSKNAQEDSFSFGHCQNHLNPPSPWPQFGQLGPFFRTSKFKIWKILEGDISTT